MNTSVSFVGVWTLLIAFGVYVLCVVGRFRSGNRCPARIVIEPPPS